MQLVIVESPTKAKTISKFLGKKFDVTSSYGHIRDLPKGEMGIDIEHDFRPHYVIPTKVRKRVNALKGLAKDADIIYFATDEDREGEAIAWHLNEIIKPDPQKIKRIAFHEITKEAIQRALQSPRSIDLNLVNAQQARRILDRLVGYELSPFLWRKITKGLSAGRVQSVAVRFIMEREREIEKSKPEEYWTIVATLLKRKTKNEKLKTNEFRANLIKIEEKKIEEIQTLKLFAGDYKIKKTSIANQKEAETIIKELKGALYKVKNITSKETKRTPPPPFITSTLQQNTNYKLGFSSRQTMLIAQQLYEGIEMAQKGSEGLITYMRTDSVNLSDKFLKEADTFIRDTFGKKYSAGIRRFKTKSKLAQEAHEAIRPTNVSQTPENIKEYLNKEQFKLYELIWKRAIASQMKEAIISSTVVDIEAHKYMLRATGSTIKFDGFMKVYDTKTEEVILPPLSRDETLELITLTPFQHSTSSPPRYSEATLVKILEQYDIGRPSTYAPTLNTIQERRYVEKIEGKFHPTEIGALVNDLLVKHFPNIIDITFTANLEGDLDKVAQGKKKWVPLIKDFYGPFKKNLEKKEKELSKKEIAEQKTEKKCPKCGKPMIIKIGRFGKFLACTGFPKCKYTEPLEEKERELQEKETNEVCEKCGAPMIVKQGRFGPFLACSNYPECKNTKPIIKSLSIKCPKCGKGEIVERRSKKGRTFYGCSEFPKCKNVYWMRPAGEKCPKCNSLLVISKKEGKIRCSNKECDFEKEMEKNKDN